jgi:hypothetical protein
MNYKYTLAHGAKQNVGDFLIRNRAVDLLEEYAGVDSDDIYFVDLVRSELTESEFEIVTETDAVIIAGGPGYQPSFYPEVYPSLGRILRSGTPIIPLGPGWKGRRESNYKFSASSQQMLQEIHNRIEIGGARDLPTKRVVESIGIENIELTGCPAWHDLNRTQESFTAPESVNSIVVSSPAKGSYRYGPQWVYLMRQISEEFPDAQKICSFHQGIGYTPGYNTRRTAAFNKTIVSAARMLGFEILDMAGQPEKYERYRDIDLHVGYRVHAHIPFLANGQPSFLIHQDGRGLGVSESLRTLVGDVSGFGTTAIKTPVDDIMRNIRRNIRNGFSDFDQVDESISKARRNMIRLIKSLP